MNEVVIEDAIRTTIYASMKTPIERLERISSGRLHKTYLATSVNKARIMLSLPSRRIDRPVVSDLCSIRAEAAILQWITSFEDEATEGLEQRKSPETNSSDCSTPPKQKGLIVRHLRAFVPRFLEHGCLVLPEYTPYNMTSPPIGIPITCLDEPLTPLERRSADYQIGQLIRRISLLQSPTNRYGYGQDIVPPVLSRFNWERNSAVIDPTTRTFTRWSESFGAMLENIIRDAQSIGLSLSYGGIRRCMDRFTKFIDSIDDARLVIIDAGSDKNTLIRRVVCHKSSMVKIVPGNERKLGSRKAKPKRKKSRSLSGTFANEERSTSTTADAEDAITKDVRVTGLREWSNTVFGDPLFSAIFSENPSTDLLRGYQDPIPEFEGSYAYSGDGTTGRKYASIRLLLYQIYHGMTTIVKEWVSDEEGSFDREMAGRKKITTAIRRLDALDDEGVPRSEDNILDMPPTKRIKKTATSARGGTIHRQKV